MHPNDTKECFASHMGFWFCEPQCLSDTVGLVQSGLYPEARVKNSLTQGEPLSVSDGIAYIPIKGMMMKGHSKFGGTSTVHARKLIREANSNKDIEGIALIIESGGGMVAGTQELGDTIRDSSKPVYAFIEDLCGSAAYWAASQAKKIYCNSMAQVGSIGTVAVVSDTSEKAEREGVKVHVVSTGDHKGAMAAGTPITDDMLADLQERIDYMFTAFRGAVIEARPQIKIDEAGDGRVFPATKAIELGLVDVIIDQDSFVSQIKNDAIIYKEREQVLARLSKR